MSRETTMSCSLPCACERVCMRACVCACVHACACFKTITISIYRQKTRRTCVRTFMRMNVLVFRIFCNRFITPIACIDWDVPMEITKRCP